MSKPSQLNKSIINCKGGWGEGKYLQTLEHIEHIHKQQKKSVSQKAILRLSLHIGGTNMHLNYTLRSGSGFFY